MTLSLLIVVVNSSDLTPTDYLALILMIDTQCSALSATFSSKDALASRWYVGLTLCGQAFAWGVILYANYQIPDTLLLSAEKDQCLTEAWLLFAVTPWRTSSARLGKINLSFKVYWYLHASDFIHAGWLAVRHTKQFDTLEKIDRETRAAVAGASINTHDTGFSRLRGTVFSNWCSFASYPVLLTLTLENHMRGIETSVWGDWGQMMPLMTLVFGVSHWFYVNGQQLYKHIFSHTSPADNAKIFPYDITRRIAMGATPAEIGEENYKLLTAEKLD
jgi:hypothetical protein